MSTATKNYLVDYNQNPELYKINFGTKYKGKMLKDINDMPYLEWCLRTHKIVAPIKQHIQHYFHSINHIPEIKEKPENVDYTLLFGKYKGRSVKEIYVEDKAYIEWILNSDKVYDAVKTKIRHCLSI